MVHTEQQQEAAATAMQDVLQAEVAAREAVEAARRQAADCVRKAHERAQALEYAAQRRIRNINSSSAAARAAIQQQLHDERERRLAGLEAHWRVDLDAELLAQAVREFASRLLDLDDHATQTGRHAA